MIIWQKQVPGLSDATFRRFLLKARRAVGLRGEFNVLITGNSRMRSLNRQYRGKDQTTDVLSFPAAENSGEAGDIAISVEIASANARTLGHSPANEIKILALHGILHLAGYDHEADKGEMARKEARLRRQLGMPDGLIERTHGSKNSTRIKKISPRNRRSRA